MSTHYITGRDAAPFVDFQKAVPISKACPSWWEKVLSWLSPAPRTPWTELTEWHRNNRKPRGVTYSFKFGVVYPRDFHTHPEKYIRYHIAEKKDDIPPVDS